MAGRPWLVTAALMAIGVVLIPTAATADSPPAPLTWTQKSFGGGANAPVDGVSCPTDEDCYAVGFNASFDAAIWSTTDGGRIWSPATLPAIDPLTAVSCLAATKCMAVGTEGAVLITRNGTTWTETHGPPTGMNGVSCVGQRFCAAVGGNVVGTTTDFGRTWSSSAIYSDGFNAVSCSAVDICAAATDSGIWTTTNGTTWTSQTIPTGAGGRGISCPDVDRCLAVAFDGDVTRTKNGTTWTLTGQNALSPPFAVDCYTRLDCEAAGSGGPDGVAVASSTNFGKTWTTTALPYSVNGNGVSCVSAKFCVVATDGAVLVGRN